MQTNEQTNNAELNNSNLITFYIRTICAQMWTENKVIILDWTIWKLIAVYSRIQPTLVYADFLKEKKISSRFQSAPFLQPPLAYKADWLNNTGCYQCFNRYPTNAPCVKWPFNWQWYKPIAADDSDRVTDDTVMRDDGESD